MRKVVIEIAQVGENTHRLVFKKGSQVIKFPGGKIPEKLDGASGRFFGLDIQLQKKLGAIVAEVPDIQAV